MPSADALREQGPTRILGKLEVEGEFDWEGTALGVFGTTPVAKAAALTAADASTVDGTYGAEEAAVLANVRTRLNELVTALTAYGFVS